MSMNQYMHPRNIYKEPPNFKELALNFPEFRKYTNQDITGKITFNFKSNEALRCLTCTLLKKDFGLDIEIPLNKLIPTVPLRLNYILWIEDLLSLFENVESVHGIDIGTGASCIYPLIAARKNKWHMLATEIDSESITFAENNVKRNSLENLVCIVKVEKESLLEEALTKFPNEYDFCMCNPPFFANTNELNPFFKARNNNRPHPKNAFCASINEVVSKGGEVEYVSKLIRESKKLNTKIKIYSSMIGHKTSLPPLKKLLRELDVVSFKQTEFCQGHTTRWGLAWTFYDIDLRKIPNSLAIAKDKQTKPLYYEIPKIDLFKKVTVVSSRLVEIFQELEFEYQEVKHVKNFLQFIIIAEKNTWSHQRRKRREKQRMNPEAINDQNSKSVQQSLEGTCEKLAQIDVSCRKRKVSEDDSGFYNSKKLKNNEFFNSSNVFLKFIISVFKVEEFVKLELMFVEGNGTKEALHQVLQFIKNKFNQQTANTP